MSDDAGLKEVVIDEVTEQVDVATLVEDGNIGEQIDAGEVGSAVGARFGERLGRELGEEIGAELHEAFSTAAEEGKGLSEIKGDLVTAVRNGIVGAFDGEDESGLRSLVEEYAGANGVDGVVGDEDSESELEEETESDERSETESDEDQETDAERDQEAEADEETDAELDESTDAELDDEIEDFEEVSVEDLEELRTETLEEYLSMVSYSELQSIAKEIDVRANLSREEMTEQIIETASESGSE